jgi:hypothetical protein
MRNLKLWKILLPLCRFIVIHSLKDFFLLQQLFFRIYCWYEFHYFDIHWRQFMIRDFYVRSNKQTNVSKRISEASKTTLDLLHFLPLDHFHDSSHSNDCNKGFSISLKIYFILSQRASHCCPRYRWIYETIRNNRNDDNISPFSCPSFNFRFLFFSFPFCLVIKDVRRKNDKTAKRSRK